LFETKQWRAIIVQLLVKNPSSEGLAAGGDIKEIRFGNFTAGFESAVPQGEWNALIEANPPTAAEQKNGTTFGAYVERIIDKALTADAMPASHKKRMAALARRTGAGAIDALDKNLKRGLLLSSEPKVGRFDEKMNRAGGIVIVHQNFRIVFDSPITQADWNKAFQFMAPKDVRKASDLIAHAETIATRILVDQSFRDKLGSAKAWYAGFIVDLPSFGRQAITFGGKWLGEIAVLRNRVDGFIEGIHIAPSEKREKQSGQAPKDMARNVSVDGNTLFLRLPAKGAYAPFGLFVGNVETVRIQRNRLDWAMPKVGGDSRFTHGIRVWGYIGRYLLIGENRISIANLGIRVQTADPIPAAQQPQLLWLIADNLVDDVSSGQAWKGPNFIEDRHNRPV
jgi:hypothetical protein